MHFAFLNRFHLVSFVSLHFYFVLVLVDFDYFVLCSEFFAVGVDFVSFDSSNFGLEMFLMLTMMDEVILADDTECKFVGAFEDSLGAVAVDLMAMEVAVALILSCTLAVGSIDIDDNIVDRSDMVLEAEVVVVVAVVVVVEAIELNFDGIDHSCWKGHLFADFALEERFEFVGFLKDNFVGESSPSLNEDSLGDYSRLDSRQLEVLVGDIVEDIDKALADSLKVDYCLVAVVDCCTCQMDELGID